MTLLGRPAPPGFRRSLEPRVPEDQAARETSRDLARPRETSRCCCAHWPVRLISNLSVREAREHGANGLLNKEAAAATLASSATRRNTWAV
ncbi:hypothetical protein EYF80_055203 [Liparis tanakae]|uniref:Uncharacterized protein n=1 Tax=Liparis tanakae TaxID=230148 RepID=A0A4Z2F0A1_9TELE|nr:hypothetical protein EYF80_055203 [Liparis tanakae]